MTVREKKEEKKAALAERFQFAANLLLNVPLGVPVEFDYVLKRKPEILSVSVVGVVEEVNEFSFRLGLLAVDHEGTWPFPAPNSSKVKGHKPDRAKANYLEILSWSVPSHEDLLTYLAHHKVYEGLHHYITQGVDAGALPMPTVRCGACGETVPWNRMKNFYSMSAKKWMKICRNCFKQRGDG